MGPEDFSTGEFEFPGRILIVGATHLHKQATAAIQELSHRLVTSPDGSNAIEIAQATEVDLVLVDDRLPDMDGMTLCRQLKADRVLRYIPVLLFVPKNKTGQSVQSLLECGANDLLYLPFNASSLQSRVRALLKYRNAIKELRDTQLHLEKRVRQRTAQLAEANMALEHEIGRRAHIEQELRAKTQVLENALDGIARLDERANIQEVNKSFAEALGYEQNELFHTNWKDHIHGKYAQAFVEAYRKLRSHAKAFTELAAVRKDGRIVILEVTLSRMSHTTENPSGFYLFSKNITARKRTEKELRDKDEQLQQGQRMEALGQLAGGVSHDFNNLLMVIRGYGDLMMGSLGGDSALGTQCNEILKAADRAQGLVGQLLAFSRRQAITPKVIDLRTIAADMEGMLQRLIGERILITTVEYEKPLPILADKGQLEQVILNLALNARDAMPDGGLLAIKTDLIERARNPWESVEGSYMGPWVRLEVEDSGAGIEPETLDRIFEPFFTTKKVGEGTGLGLATVYGIVKQSGGFLSVQSTVGEGSLFSVFLPLHYEREQEIPLERESCFDGSGHEVILLVEDEESVRALITEALTEKGYAVLSFSDGLAAYNYAKDHMDEIDLILTDIIMPVMTGPEFVRKLMADHPDLKVVFMSGYTSDLKLDGGPWGKDPVLLNKPIRPAEIIQTIRPILDEEVWEPVKTRAS